MTTHTEKSTAEEDSDIIEFLNRKLANLTVASDAAEVLGKNDDGLPVCEVSMLLPHYAEVVYNALHSSVRQLRLAAVVRLRKYLSLQNVDERVDNVLALGIIPLLIEFLECYHDNLLQYETAWIITNIAAGSTQHTQALVAGDVTQHLIKVLTTSSNIEVQTQIIWALGNIAGDGAVFRDIILSAGVIDPLLYILTHYDKYDYMAVRITVWATANMCRGCRCSDPSWSLITPAFPILGAMVQLNDIEIISDACWGMSRILNGTHKHREHALKQTQSVIDAGALTVLTSSFLTTKNLTLRRDACLAVSNVAAGTYKQVNAVLTEPNLMENIVALLWDNDMKVVKEACWVLSNSTSLHNPGHIQIILQHDIISPFLHHLRIPGTSHEILNKLIDTLVNILSVGDLSGPNSSQILANEYADKLASAGIVEALIMTWNNPVINEVVKEKVRGLLERWFYGYLPRNEENGDEIEEDIASIEERVSRLTIMGGVF
ncbi:5958_t:CDS:10 [Dentiscutata erythropus]|uniref:Importin subunit alpha n=1 Tax=Dentiscutata erythropus TaxID=1348616 RepID=A0A9N8ZUY8_9GLOM|nr:5958_t:CDS:10 [Dentiscutata erythropus]